MILLSFFARASQRTGNPGKSCSLPVLLDLSHQKSSGVVVCGMCCGEGSAGGAMLGLLVLWITCQPASVRIMCKIPAGKSFPLEGILLSGMLQRKC